MSVSKQNFHLLVNYPCNLIYAFNIIFFELLKACLHCNLHLTVVFIPKSQRLFVGRSWHPPFFSPFLSKLSTMSFQEQSWLAESDAVICRACKLCWLWFSSTGAFEVKTSSSFWSQSFWRPWDAESMSGAVRRILGRRWYYYRLLGRSRHRQNVLSRRRCRTAIKGDFIFLCLSWIKRVLCWGYRGVPLYSYAFMTFFIFWSYWLNIHRIIEFALESDGNLSALRNWQKCLTDYSFQSE